MSTKVESGRVDDFANGLSRWVVGSTVVGATRFVGATTVAVYDVGCLVLGGLGSVAPFCPGLRSSARKLVAASWNDAGEKYGTIMLSAAVALPLIGDAVARRIDNQAKEILRLKDELVKAQEKLPSLAAVKV